VQARANAPVQRTLHAEEACEVSRREGEQLAAINLVEQEGCFMLPQLQSAQPLPDLGASNHQGENIPSTSPCGIHNCNPHMSCCSPSTTLLPTTLMHLRTTVGQNAIAAKPLRLQQHPRRCASGRTDVLLEAQHRKHLFRIARTPLRPPVPHLLEH
jgi:hypothetical protein